MFITLADIQSGYMMTFKKFKYIGDSSVTVFI